VKKDSETLDDQEKENFFNLLRMTSQFSSSMGETVVSGKITSIATGDVEKGEQLAEASRQAGQMTLELLGKLKTVSDPDEQVARLDEVVKKVVRLLNDLLPKIHDISKEEIGDLVEKEMQNTTQAIEAAVAKLQVNTSSCYICLFLY